MIQIGRAALSRGSLEGPIEPNAAHRRGPRRVGRAWKDRGRVRRVVGFAGLFLALLTLFAARGSAADTPKYQRTMETLAIPDVVLVNQDGQKVRLKQLLESDQFVVVDYIYGTCTTICPVLSAGYSNLQKKLGTGSQKVHLVSISIDPENDTPRIMKDYLKRYRAKPGWDFLTGSRADIDRVMRAFNAYVENKMSHYPITFLKGPGSAEWVRIYGLLSTSDLLAECRKIGAKL